MDTKKTITALAIAVAVSAAVYFIYKKFFPSGLAVSSNLSSDAGGSNNSNIVSEQDFDTLAQIALASLSDSEKQDAYHIASRIYDDCKGWNSHNMSMYDYLAKWNNAKFYFFVTRAYPSYDNRSLTDRLKMQNWGALNSWSKNNGYNTKDKAERKINEIIYRVENFKF
jgi:hypothetical protein